MHTKLKTRLMIIWLILASVILCAISINMIFADTKIKQDVGVGISYTAKLAFTLNSDGESYSVKAKSTSISGTVAIPKSYKGKPVTTIASSGFYSCTNLTRVIIPNSVTRIEVWAFRNCIDLSYITIPDSVTSIGSEAFAYCSDFNSVSIPKNVSQIGYGVFEGCNLNWIYSSSSYYPVYGYCLIEKSSKKLIAGCNNSEIPTNGSVTSIGSGAFENCSSLESIAIPNTVTSIGDSAFERCSSLESVTIPDSVTSIGELAFWRCDELTTVTIGSGVKEMGDNPFRHCSSLTTLNVVNNSTYHATDNCLIETKTKTLISGFKTSTIPKDGSVTNIGVYAFADYTTFGDVTIPSKVTTISQLAFFYCRGLTAITIPSSVTSIGRSAFDHCTGLTSITIPSSVTTVGDDIFADCTYLATAKIYCKEIGEDMFDNCYRLTSVIIGLNVESIKNYAFDNCYILKSLTIPESVTSIGYRAFMGCSYLEKVNFINTSDWWYSTDEDAKSGTSLTLTNDDAGQAQAASYLKSPSYYRDYYWKCSS